MDLQLQDGFTFLTKGDYGNYRSKTGGVKAFRTLGLLRVRQLPSDRLQNLSGFALTETIDK